MSKEVPERIWLRANPESRFGVSAVWSPTLESDFNIAYVPATELQRVREDTWKAAIALVETASTKTYSFRGNDEMNAMTFKLNALDLLKTAQRFEAAATADKEKQDAE